MALFKNILVLMLLAIIISCKSTKIGTEEVPIKLLISDKNLKPSTAGIIKAEVNKNILNLHIGDTNFCSVKNVMYTLSTNFELNKSNPPQLKLYLFNPKSTEACTSDSSIHLYYDLTSIAEEFSKRNYNYKNIVLNINGKNAGIYPLK